MYPSRPDPPFARPAPSYPRAHHPDSGLIGDFHARCCRIAPVSTVLRPLFSLTASAAASCRSLKQDGFRGLNTNTKLPENPPMSRTPSEANPIEGWLVQQYAKKACDDPWSIERYSACRLLQESGIPCYLWAEDTLAYYGVPTVVFGVQIVVSDIKKAADALVERGWHPPPSDFEPKYIDIKEATCYLVEPQCKSVGLLDNVVALTAASDWDIKLPEIATQKSWHRQRTARWPFIPPLHQFLDSLIRRWLNTPDAHFFFRSHIGCFLGYLYGYIPILKLREFADYLKVEHRQYHLDVIAGVSYTREPFRIHSQKIRDSILRGEYEFRECSVSRDDERFFTADVEARLLATLPPANHT
ncbi:hypothetical protein AJ78_03760 [Emergomyces pasteurianus Ep9510]|uniref:Uncharacterized protein n=1 Tax=Emergomyces pasteurianus Ep9510 TaxID=1447872 RepID=A0A1J9QIP6_9EURO|nr:hypothetical protein AJ78_03760 [Emergomyces pasteurianus Ep9510]